MRPAWAIARPAARRKREQRRPEAIRGGIFASGRVGFVPSQTARFGQSREGRILRCWGCPPPRGGVARGNPPLAGGTQCRQFALRRRRFGRRNAAACPVPASGRRAPASPGKEHPARSARVSHRRAGRTPWQALAAEVFPRPACEAARQTPSACSEGGGWRRRPLLRVRRALGMHRGHGQFEVG